MVVELYKEEVHGEELVGWGMIGMEVVVRIEVKERKISTEWCEWLISDERKGVGDRCCIALHGSRIHNHEACI